jgi:hypothetical protein
MSCSRKSVQTVPEAGTLIGHLITLSSLILITIAGIMVTKWLVPIHAKLACIPRTDTIVRPSRPKTWEYPKPTRIDF